MKKKNILISSKPIPTTEIGSWNVLLTDLLIKEPDFFDFIISPQTSEKIDDVNIFVKESTQNTLILKRFNENYAKKHYWDKLKPLLVSKSNVNIIIFDDIKLLLAIDFFSKKNMIRESVKLIYFLRGYRFDINVNQRNKLYSCIDKLVVQTESSYLNQVKENHTIPCEVDILKNGIDSKVFYPLKKQEKEKLRKDLNFKPNKKYFLWISQDRPKKGLSIVLKAWRKVIEENNDIELLILGTHKEIIGKQITWLGRKKNKELAKFYQATDYYLFSTLCHEGHPLSLTEALKAGAKCLASDIDPVSEVLNNGDLGYLVKNPHFVDSWINGINDVMKSNFDFNKNNIDLHKIYDQDTWINKFKEILNREQC